MTELPKPKEAPKVAAKPAQQDPVEQLQALLDKLTPEQREQMERIGMRVPIGDITSAANGRFKYGLRCVHCNKIALMFLGDTWKMGGIETDLPPGVHHSKIAWTQNLPAEEIDRNIPKCQHCHEPVTLNPDGSFTRERRMVEIARFEQQRDAAFDKKFLRKFKTEVNKGEGATVQVPSSYNAPDKPVSKVIEEKFGPNALKELQQVADMTGVSELVATGKLPG